MAVVFWTLGNTALRSIKIADLGLFEAKSFQPLDFALQQLKLSSQGGT